MDLLDELHAQLVLANVPLTSTSSEAGSCTNLLFEPGEGLASFDATSGGPRLVNLILCTYVGGEWWLGKDEPIRPLADLLISMVVNGARTSGDGNFAWVDSLLTGQVLRYPAPWFGSRREPREVEQFDGSVDPAQVTAWMASWRS